MFLLPYWLAWLCPTTVVSWKLAPSKQAPMLIKDRSRREVDLLGIWSHLKRRWDLLEVMYCKLSFPRSILNWLQWLSCLSPLCLYTYIYYTEHHDDAYTLCYVIHIKEDSKGIRWNHTSCRFFRHRRNCGRIGILKHPGMSLLGGFFMDYRFQIVQLKGFILDSTWITLRPLSRRVHLAKIWGKQRLPRCFVFWLRSYVRMWWRAYFSRCKYVRMCVFLHACDGCGGGF